jgi:hypothetical protein
MAGARAVITLDQEGGYLLSKRLFTNFGVEDDYVKDLLRSLKEEDQSVEAGKYEELLKEKVAERSGQKKEKEAVASSTALLPVNFRGIKQNMEKILSSLKYILDEEIIVSDTEENKIVTESSVSRGNDINKNNNNQESIAVTVPLDDIGLTVCPLPTSVTTSSTGGVSSGMSGVSER